MVLKAREKYPHIEFIVANAENFSVENQFDAVFSNAALHWVLEPDRAADCIFNSLKKGGRFVAEFGGKGNVKNIRDALKNSLNKTSRGRTFL